MTKLLVTGGAGFIGSHLADRLIADGHEVVVLDNLSTGKKKNLNPRAKFVECDIADYEKIAPHFAGVECVFHLAAQARIQPSIANPLPWNKSNITGTLNVLWAAYKAGVKKLVYSASSSVYGDQNRLPLTEDMTPRPKSPYGLQKLVGEMYCRLFSELYKFPTVVLRYFNVYGPRQTTEADGPYATVIGIFLDRFKNREPLPIVGDGEQQRDFTYVSDVVEANILAWQKEVLGGEIFNIGTGKNYSINEVAKIIGGESAHIPPRPAETRVTLADNTKAGKLLGWQPKNSLEKGIAELKKLYGLS